MGWWLRLGFHRQVVNVVCLGGWILETGRGGKMGFEGEGGESRMATPRFWPRRLGSDCGRADFGGRNLRSVGRFEHGAAIPPSRHLDAWCHGERLGVGYGFGASAYELH